MYLDNAATTQVLPSVKPIFETYAFDRFYNPSGLYNQAITVAQDIRAARSDLAQMMGVEEGSVYYTSCGTESDNTALLMCKKPRGARIIVANAEHAAVQQCAHLLKQQGYDVVFCPVDGVGRVQPQALQNLLTDNTCLVSVMHVNNETGAVNDIAALCRLVKSYNPSILFHCDGVQALGHIPFSLRALGVDMYAVSGHKIGAPKGIGALYIKNGVYVAPLFNGGGQERGLRSGTENVVGIVSLSHCAGQYAAANRQLVQKGQTLRQAMRAFADSHPQCVLLDEGAMAPHIVTLVFGNVRGEVMMHALQQYDITVGIGSACSSKKGTARIPMALGLQGGYQTGMLRLSINPFDVYDWDYLVEKMDIVYAQLCRYTRV